MEMRTEMEEKRVIRGTVETDGFSTGYIRFGQGSRALVILPGISIRSVLDSADAVAGAFERFTEDYTVCLLDVRSSLPRSYSVAERAEDAAKAIRALGLKKVSLYGVSYGSMASMEIAVRYPELVEKMVLASSSAHVRAEDFHTLENWICLAEKRDAGKLCLAFGEALYPRDVFEQTQSLLLSLAKTVTHEEMERFVIQAEGIRGFCVADRLEKIRCPVLLLGDRQDRALGTEGMERIISCLGRRADFRWHMYDGYGHGVYDLAPDFRERILDFLLHFPER